MTVTYRCIGKGTTDSNGVAHMTKKTSDGGSTWSDATGYTGTGAGELDLVASTVAPDSIDESSYQSEPFILCDAIVKDIGTTNDHNDSLWNSVSDFTRGADNTSVSLSAQSYTPQYDVGDGLVAEFELVEVTNTCRCQIARYQTGETTSYHYQDFTNTGLVRIEVTTSQIIFKLDNTVLQTINNTTNNKMRFFFTMVTGQTPTFKFKNLRIYPL